ncbi:MAG TPA: T9SS type A sorting domain-containing protein [Saprospiraceae bacterium]|nr:T9SS type A sorting domain-containing protein [Saprospiraceae bacterium]
MFHLSKLQFFGLLLVSAFLFIARASDPDDGRTNAPGEGQCSNCHTQGSNNISGSVSISGLPSTLQPNTNYSITVTVNNSSVPLTNADKGGFQLVALDGSNSNSGTFSSPGSNSKISAGTRTYWEHSGAKSFNGGSSVSYTVVWKSPVFASGNTISMYVCSILSNGNGNNGGDEEVLSSVSASLIGSSPVNAVISSFSNISCNGGADGSIKVTASSGQTPYNYLWNTGATTAMISNLVAGSYSCTVTDANNSEAVVSKTLTEPSAININPVIHKDNVCYGESKGSLQVSATGGTPQYTFKWSTGAIGNSISNLAKGDYGITVTDSKNCTNTSSFTITEPDKVELIVDSIYNPSCPNSADGKIIISTISGGTSPYKLKWNTRDSVPKLRNLLSGKYTLTITDANLCVQIFSYELKTVDSIPPNVLFKSNIRVNLDSNGSYKFKVEDFIESATDKCTNNVKISFSKDSLDCSSVGKNEVIITVSDSFNNRFKDTVEFTVIDPVKPYFAEAGVQRFFDCNRLLQLPQVKDNCPVQSVTIISGQTLGSLFKKGKTIVIYKIVDQQSNSFIDSIEYHLIPRIDISIQRMQESPCFEDGAFVDLHCINNTDSFFKIYINGDSIINLKNDTTLTNIKITTKNISVYSDLDVECKDFWIIDSIRNNTPILVDKSSIIDASSSSSTDGSIALEISGGKSGYTFEWFDQNNNFIGNTNPIDKLKTGQYFCNIKDANLCRKSFGPFEVKFTSNNLTYNNNDQIVLFPNPVSGFFQIKSNAVIDEISIYNSNGQNQFNIKPKSGFVQIDTENFPKGIYYVQILSNQKKVTQKLIIQ